MQYRVAAINLEGDVAAAKADTYDEAKRLFDVVRTLPWGQAVAIEIQCSIDAETWTTIGRLDRDAVEVAIHEERM
jgi:hypothetical protein